MIRITGIGDHDRPERGEFTAAAGAVAPLNVDQHLIT
jgi:hypothetical protein